MPRVTKRNRKLRRSFSKRQGKPGISSDMPTFQADIAIFFLQMLNKVKLYHWKTYSHATHKATDELYSKLNDHIDTFIEVLLGKTQSRIDIDKSNMFCIPVRDFYSNEEMKKEVDNYKSYLVGLEQQPALQTMSNTDLFNIRDEILGDLNQFLYLLTFTK